LGVANIGVMGTGYVGLTTAVCFSELGHKVVGFDIDTKKVETLKSGISTIYEDGMSELIVKNLKNNNLIFTHSISHLSDCDFVFLCVPTPQDSDGSADLSYVIKAARDLNGVLKKNAILVTKSTVPVNAGVNVCEPAEVNICTTPFARPTFDPAYKIVLPPVPIDALLIPVIGRQPVAS
jgi:UDPglucose 6-dehydrogenase